MFINNDRKHSDHALLDSTCWSGILQGKDDYPKMNSFYENEYNIGGGESGSFKAISIEFHGLKT